MTLTRAAPESRPAPIEGAPAIVSIRGLTKRFTRQRTWVEVVRSPFGGDKITVVNNVTCDIRRGEFFGLLGPNGAGKTTLFKMLATLVIPDEGSASVAGFDIVGQPKEVRARLTPVIADERSLNWRLSARENLRVFAALYNLQGAAATRRIDEVLDGVELHDAGHKIVGQFSSGMKQRLLIARALLSSPQVLLLDEPTRSLDPLSARRFRTFLRDEIVGRQGCTAILATHNTEEALELCDRVAVLNRGTLLAVDTPDALSHQVAQERYRIWTRDPRHRSLDRLAAESRIELVQRQPPDSEGWSVLDVRLPGGLDDAAEVLSRLALEGAEIARFERIGVSLADLIEHVLNRTRPPSAGEGNA